MSDKKDIWDKLDICSRLIIPILIATSVWLWNHERTKTETAARMTEIAILILTSDRATDNEPDPIRLWAVNVLQDPSSPPPISLEAAAQLSNDPELLQRADMRAMVNTLIETELMKYVLEDFNRNPSEEVEVTPYPNP